MTHVKDHIDLGLRDDHIDPGLSDDHIDLGLSDGREATMQRQTSARQYLDLEHDDLGVSMVDIVYILLTGREDGSLHSRQLCELGNASCPMHCC